MKPINEYIKESSENYGADYLEYMDAIVNYGSDPALIENEDDAMSLASAIERSQSGVREIEKGSEEWYNALKQLNLNDTNNVKHIYSCVDGSEFVFCKAEDYD